MATIEIMQTANGINEVLCSHECFLYCLLFTDDIVNRCKWADKEGRCPGPNCPGPGVYELVKKEI
jgi:hypothetical protein